jgi:hypothetical protein
MDFSHKRYREILQTFLLGGYTFFTFEDYIRKNPKGRVVVLRHDVDRFPKKALELALIESEKNIRSTYFFRIKKRVFRPKIIKMIGELGHEIGYHYEDLVSAKGNFDKALTLFKMHLENIRKYSPVSTISMHGSPLSKFNNKLLWEKFDYKEYGIIAEPYIDVDYEKVLYITDASRRWNDEAVNIRDRIKGLKTGPIRSSKQILKWLRDEQLNDTVLLNTHPDRWHSNIVIWIYDLIFQTIKNKLKELIVKIRKNKD